MKRILLLTVLLVGLSCGTAVAGAPSGHHSHDGVNPFAVEHTQDAQPLHCLLNGHVHSNQPCPHRGHHRSAHSEIGLDCGGQQEGTVPSVSFLSNKTFTATAIGCDLPMSATNAAFARTSRYIVPPGVQPPSPPPKSF